MSAHSYAFFGKKREKCNTPASERVFNELVEKSTIYHQNIFDLHLPDKSSLTSPLPYIGSNISLVGCEAPKTPGIEVITANINQSFNQGFSCMDRISKIAKKAAMENRSLLGEDQAKQMISRSERIREIGQKMIGNFLTGSNRPFTFHCTKPGINKSGKGRVQDMQNLVSFGVLTGQLGTAHTCDEDEKHDNKFAPLIALNINDLNDSTNGEQQQVIFHELIHHGGIQHDKLAKHEQDWVYGIEWCCFGRGSDEEDPFSNYRCVDLFKSDHNKRASSFYDENAAATVLRNTKI